MKEKSLTDIKIRTELQPGDIGYIIYMHGNLYSEEYGYSITFENYVAKGLSEFYIYYDPLKDRVWICEHKNKIVGFLLLMGRNKIAQLRFFILHPDYRGIGLGKKLMNLYMEFFSKCNYESSYLWTTSELTTAAHLYTSNGFVLTEEKESDLFGKHLTEQKYEFKFPKK